LMIAIVLIIGSISATLRGYSSKPSVTPEFLDSLKRRRKV